MKLSRIGPLLLLFLVLCVGMNGCGSASPVTITKPAAKTQWDAVLAGIRPDGTYSVETALQAFSVAIAPLPGVPLPAGTPVHLLSGTMAVDMVMSHWKELSAQQQQEINKLLPSPPLSSASADDNHAAVALSQRAGSPTPTTAQALQARAEQAWTQIATHLHRNKLTIQVFLLKTMRTTATTDVFDDMGNHSGAPSRCDILVNSSDLARFPFTPIDLQIIMTHEVTHCFELSVNPLQITYPPFGWITEGLAEWAGFAITGFNYSVPDYYEYPTYIRYPEIPLFTRRYDAVGFYDHMTQQGIDVWSKFDAMCLADTSNAAFAAAIPDSVKAAFFDSWGASYFRHPAYGSDWDMQGAGVTPDTAPIGRAHVGSGGAAAGVTIKAFALSSSLYQINVDSDVEVLHFVTTGYARLHDSGTVDSGDQGPATEYSLAGHPNTCPPGTPDAGQKLPTLTGPISLAVTGDEMGSGVAIIGEKLQDVCKKPCPLPNAPGTLRFSAEILQDSCEPSASDIYQKAVEAASKLQDASFNYVTEIPSTSTTTADGVITRSPLRLELMNMIVTTAIGNTPAGPIIYDNASGLIYFHSGNGWTTIPLGNSATPPIFSAALLLPPSTWKMNSGVTIENVNGRLTYHLSGDSDGDHIDLWIRTDDYNVAKRIDHNSSASYSFTFTAWNSGATIALP